LRAITQQATDNSKLKTQNSKLLLVAVAAAYLALAVLYTWPLAAHFSAAVPGIVTSQLKTSTVDQDQVLWSLWWTARSLGSGHNPYLTTLLYYPYNAASFGHPALSLYLFDLQILHTVLGWPLVQLAGLVSAYNFIVLFSFVVAAWGTYLLARDRGIGSGGAFFVGLVYGLGPYHQTQLFASVPRIALEALPFFALFFLRAIEGQGRLSWLWAGLALAATNLLDWYYAMHAAVLAGLLLLYAAIAALIRSRADLWPRLRGPLLRVVASFAVWLILMLPLLLPALGEIRSAQANVQPNVNGAAFNSIFPTQQTLEAGAADLLDFIRPSRDAQGVWLQSPFVGYVTLALALLGIAAAWSGRKRAKQGHEVAPNTAAQSLITQNSKLITHNSWSEALRWLWVALATMILALGPTLQVAGVRTGLPLPYTLLSKLPLFNTFQYPWRISNLTVLALALLAGIGLTALMDASQRIVKPDKPISRSIAAILTVAAAAIVTLEFLALPTPLYTPQPPVFFTQVGSEPGDFAILELPITNHQTSDHRRMLNQTAHGKPIIGGYLPRPRPDPYRAPDSPFAPLIELPPNPDIVLLTASDLAALMNFYDFRYLVVYSNTMDAGYPKSWLADALRQPSFTPVYSDTDTLAYRAAPGDGQPHLYLGSDWYAPEAQGSAMKRWISGSDGHFSVLTPQPGRYRVSFDAVSFAKPRQMLIAVDGKVVTTITIGTAVQGQSMTLDLAPGMHSIALHTDGADSPKALGQGDDDRLLSVALLNLRVAKVEIGLTQLNPRQVRFRRGEPLFALLNCVSLLKAES
jgi:hypothetical protein